MHELMKIDVKKFHLKRQPGYFLLAILIMAMMIFGVLYVDNGSLIDSAPIIIDVLVKPVFIIWEAVLISSIIIDEFKNKTILMLYTYPINKKKLILSKVFLVVGYSLLGIIASQLILNLLFFGIHQFVPAIPYTLTLNQAMGYLVSSVLVVLLGLIPLSVGLLKYSSVATMVSSIIIILMGSSSGLGFDQLLTQIGFVSALGIAGTVATIYSIGKIFRRDVIV